MASPFTSRRWDTLITQREYRRFTPGNIFFTVDAAKAHSHIRKFVFLSRPYMNVNGFLLVDVQQIPFNPTQMVDFNAKQICLHDYSALGPNGYNRNKMFYTPRAALNYLSLCRSEFSPDAEDQPTFEFTLGGMLGEPIC